MTMQRFGVMALALSLGARIAVGSVGLYLDQGAFGLPLFAGGWRYRLYVRTYRRLSSRISSHGSASRLAWQTGAGIGQFLSPSHRC